MADKVSPLCTTYLVVRVVAVTGAAATLNVLVRMTSVLLAMRVFAWATGTDPFMATATRMIGRMLQASTTHADFVHARMVLSLSFQGIQRRTLLVRTPMARTGGKERDLGGRHLWQVRPPDRLRGGTTRQPQQDQGEKCDQRSGGATLGSAPAGAAGAAARTSAAVGAATRRGRQPGQRRRRRHWRTGARDRC